MNKSIKKLVNACQRLSALGSNLTREAWLVEWNRFSKLQDEHLARNEGLLELEPLAALEPNIGESS